MADEADNLVLVHLREIRSKLGEFDTFRTEVFSRFDRVEARFDELGGYVKYALGLGTMCELKLREHEARQEAERARSDRIEALYAELERRLTKVETKPD